MELKTPLYDCHVAGGGKIATFCRVSSSRTIPNRRNCRGRTTWQYATTLDCLMSPTWERS